MLLVRHASAGDRDSWSGEDRLRPLDERGRGQAARLPERLASYRVEAVLTSPALRCVETVAPLAAALGLTIDLRHELGEDRHDGEGVDLVRSLAGRDVVVCGHGGLQAALVDPPKWKKGSIFVVDGELKVVRRLRA
jgi:8-oxo-dGTP diphosphatase